MIRRIIAASLELRYLLLAAGVALLGFGIREAGQMPVDVFPEFAPPTVEVQTEAVGLSADEVESLITLGLEELLSGVPWLDSTRSRSVTGLSTITLIFQRGTDLIKARQMVQERLTLEYKLPNVATPPVILQPVSSTNRFMMIGISSDTIESTELSLLARWTIKPRLVGVPGVANVAIWGQRLRQLHVHIDPERLREARVTQDEVIAAAGDALWVSPLTFLKASATGAGGWIDNRNQRLGVEHAMPISTPEDLAKVPIVTEPELRFGRAVPLGDVAELTFSHPPLIGDAYVNGHNGLLLVLEKFPAAGVPEVTRNVEAALDELARGLPGVTIDTSVFRLASYLHDSAINLAGAIAAGALLLALVTGALLRSWRSALILLGVVTVSLVAGMIVLYQAEVTFNAMVFAGLVVALAVVIDEVLVDTNRIVARLRARGANTPALAAILDAASETRATALYATLIVLLSVVPVLSIGGVAGAFLQPFAWTYVLAILTSTLVALTLTPALASILLDDRHSESVSRLEPLTARYEERLRRVMAAPGPAYIALGLLAVAAVGASMIPGQSLVPTLREREVVVTWSTPPGTSHAETQRITARVSRELQTVPGVKSVGAHVGRAVTGDQIVGMNASQIWVGIDPRANHEQTVAAVREVIDGYPGIERSTHTYLHNKVNGLLTGENNTVVVRVYGPKRDVRVQKAEDVRKAIENVPGLVDLKVEGEIEEPQVQVNVNLEAAGKADLKPGDVRRASATLFSGIVVGYLFKEQKIFEVVVWGAPEVRQSLANLGDLWIDKADRTRVRLRDVANVNIRSTPTVIRHERMAPYVDVVANISGRPMRAVAADVQDQLRQMTFPLEHRAELLGEALERDTARRQTVLVLVASLIGIFLLFQACFLSWGLAAVAAAGVAGAVAAGAVASLLVGGASSMGSVLGLLAVLGISARNAILTVEQYRTLEDQQGMAVDADLVVRGASERLSAVVVSAAAIIAALLPMVALRTATGLEIPHAIAVVIVGGTLASALISLFLIPPLYLLIRSRTNRATALTL